MEPRKYTRWEDSISKRVYDRINKEWRPTRKELSVFLFGNDDPVSLIPTNSVVQTVRKRFKKEGKLFYSTLDEGGERTYKILTSPKEKERIANRYEKRSRQAFDEIVFVDSILGIDSPEEMMTKLNVRESIVGLQKYIYESHISDMNTLKEAIKLKLNLSKNDDTAN